VKPAWWLGLACASCTSAPPAGDLGGALAVVGSHRLDARLVARSAESPATFVAAWTRMELLAQAAEMRGLVHEPATSALARRLLSAWTAAASSPPDPRPEEIELARKEQWQRFDCGPAIMVHHAVFMKSRAPKPTFAADAMELGRALHDRIQPDWDFAKFEAAAKAMPLPPGVEVRAEQLPAFVEDGRATEGPSGFDATFAKQAFTLQKPGDFTAAFETPFGVHVVQLEKKVDPVHPTDAEVREALRPDLIAQRVRRLQSAAIQSHRAQDSSIAETATADMENVVRALLGQEGTEAAKAP
jgi:hypothetical protein